MNVNTLRQRGLIALLVSAGWIATLSLADATEFYYVYVRGETDYSSVTYALPNGETEISPRNGKCGGQMEWNPGQDRGKVGPLPASFTVDSRPRFLPCRHEWEDNRPPSVVHLSNECVILQSAISQRNPPMFARCFGRREFCFLNSTIREECPST